MEEDTQQEEILCHWSPGQHIAQGVILALAAGTVGYFIGKRVTEMRFTKIFDGLEGEIAENAKAQVEHLINELGYDQHLSGVHVDFTKSIEDEVGRKLDRVEEPDGPQSSEEDPVREHDLDDDIPEEPVDYRDRGQELLDTHTDNLERVFPDGVPDPKEIEQALEEDIEPGVVMRTDVDNATIMPWDWKRELAERNKRVQQGVPYLLHEDEWTNREMDFEQITLTYYEGDAVLADDQDEPIQVVGPYIGDDTLDNFGKGTGDENTVFVRNERLKAEFEICRSDGKYAHEVLGLEHSEGGPRSRRLANQPRKFRDDV